MSQMTREQMMAVPNLLNPAQIVGRQIQKWRSLLNIFQNEQGTPLGKILTLTQVLIIVIISKRLFPRVILILPTQYGKSLAVALGVLLRVATHKEKWAIVAPTEEKARIIMDYIINHIFDDPVFLEQLEYHGSKEKLLQERSKVRITFRDGGEVRVYSGNANNANQTKKALMGFGAPNLVLDESAQINDELYATAKRMVAGSKDNFVLEIGNPAFRNHFLRTWFGGRYKKIFVDAIMALEEGRYTKDYLEEMKEEAGYEWMFDCLFPPADAVLANGYRRLLNDDVVDGAFEVEVPELTYRLDEEGNPEKNEWGHEIVDDRPILGIDVKGSGAAKNKFVVRFPRHGFSIVAGSSMDEDLEDVADQAEEIIKRWSIGDYRIVVDAGGPGHGLPAILKRRGYLIKAVLFGEGSPETKGFKNMRAWMYWEVRKAVREGHKLVGDDGFLELKLIYYKQDSSLRVQIEPKEDMIKRKAKEGEKVASPDTSDAFALTFVDTSSIVEEDDIDID